MGDGVVTVTTVGAEVAVQPFSSVTATVYEPLVVTVIICVVAPVLHSHDAPAEAVRSTLLPVQKLVGPLAVIVGVLTVTVVAEEVPVQPLVVTATVYSPLVVTVMLFVVSPLLHR